MKPSLSLVLAVAAVVPCLTAQSQMPRSLQVNFSGTTVIDEPGAYIMPRDMDIPNDRVAIDITASGVTLDLGGRSLRGPGGKLGTGIRINNAQGVRIYNGRISNFAFNVTVANSANVVIKDLQITGQGLVITAPPPEVGIMIVQSRGVTVENNSLYNVGLGIFVRGGMSFGNRIAHNIVTAGMNGIIGICYNPAPGDPTGPRGDLLYANHVTGYATGIQMATSAPANVLQNNFVAHRGKGIENLNTTNVVEGNTQILLP
jgi:Periplasmic copper-binding protein (NosD)